MNGYIRLMSEKLCEGVVDTNFTVEWLSAMTISEHLVIYNTILYPLAILMNRRQFSTIELTERLNTNCVLTELN